MSNKVTMETKAEDRVANSNHKHAVTIVTLLQYICLGNQTSASRKRLTWVQDAEWSGLRVATLTLADVGGETATLGVLDRTGVVVACLTGLAKAWLCEGQEQTISIVKHLQYQ